MQRSTVPPKSGSGEIRRQTPRAAFRETFRSRCRVPDCRSRRSLFVSNCHGRSAGRYMRFDLASAQERDVGVAERGCFLRAFPSGFSEDASIALHRYTIVDPARGVIADEIAPMELAETF